jgi:DHA1 family bicyclomycin/chloramphenicol resistance-like MFS transporter
VVCAWNNWLSLAGIIALLFAFLCCLGFINPNTAALSLAPFTKNAGSASSLMGAIQMGIGSLASTVVSLYNTHTATPMAVTMCGSSLLALLILVICSRNIRTAVTASPAGAAMAH